MHVPTSVTHAASGYFSTPAPPPGTTAATAPLRNLIVVRHTLLELYTAITSPNDTGSVHLVLLTQHKLFGVVESLAVLRNRTGNNHASRGAGHDAILLTFRDAKLSVLQWDPAVADLVPSSLHYFEGDESLKAGRHAFPRPPTVVTDPAGRCAAVIMLRHQLAVLPATESESASLGVVLDDPYSTGGQSTTTAPATTTNTAALGNSYVDNLNKMNIREVRDAVFLYGSAEPTLLVLHEVDPTWAGNLRHRKDTCSLSALSLNLSSKRHPRIWGANNLPSDAYKLIAVPSGGALCLCVSGIILYYSQGSVQAGIVLNTAVLPAPLPPPPLVFDLPKEQPGQTAAKYAKEHGMRLHPAAASHVLSFCDTTSASSWNVECDAAHMCWISRTTAVLGLRSGQLVLVEVVKRGGGGAVRVQVAKAGAAPPASAMTLLSPSVVFIGSCAGDSLLLRCIMASGEGDGDGDNNISVEKETKGREGVGVKRRRLESGDADQVGVLEDTAAAAGGGGDRRQVDDDDDDKEAFLMYGSEGGEGDGSGPAPSDLRCSLSVLDSFIGLGPIRSMASSTPISSAASPLPYLVACVGSDRGGALVVLRRTVAPDIVTNIPLQGLKHVYAVGRSTTAATKKELLSSYHSYLLLSFEASTKVMTTNGGQELKETSGEDFVVHCPTLAAGTVVSSGASSTYIVQVVEHGVFVFDAGTGKSVGRDSGITDVRNRKILDVCIEDPFVLILMDDGTATLLHIGVVDNLKNNNEVEVVEVGTIGSVEKGARVTACCVYRDSSGWMPYPHPGSNDKDREADVYLCVACFQDGSCAIMTVDVLGSKGLWEVWRTNGLTDGATILSSTSSTTTPAPTTTLPNVEIVQVRMDCFVSLRGSGGVQQQKASAPILLALTSDHCLYAYTAFVDSSSSTATELHSSLQFRRMHHLDLPPLLMPTPTTSTTPTPTKIKLHRFDDIGEQIPHSGIFISGPTPYWLIAARGTLFAHPHATTITTTNNTVESFSCFHNSNSPHAFITISTNGGMQISELPARQRLDAPWPRQKIAIKSTPHRICLYPEAQLFALCASRTVPSSSKPYLPEEEGGEPQASYCYALAATAAAARPTAPLHELRLISPGTWATLWQYSLQPGEFALTVDAVYLRDATTGATMPLLAVGAGFAAGEDYPCSGRVLLFEVKKNDANKFVAEMIYAREFKGPVTGVATMEGHLLISTGHRLETCTLMSSSTTSGDGQVTRTRYKMMRSSFYDGPSLVTSLCVVKSFALLGDAHFGVHFVRYKEEGRQLAMLGKDFGRASVQAAQFLIAGSSLHIVMADASGSLRTYTYAPGDPSSWKGQKLVPWGVLFIGERVGTLVRLKMPQPEASDTTPRQAAVYGTDSGGLGAVMPLAIGDHIMPHRAQEQSQQQQGEGQPPQQPAKQSVGGALKALQKELITGVVHTAGLNPAAFRRRHAKVPLAMEGGCLYGMAPLTLGAQGVLDGDLLMKYASLPRPVQSRLAGRAGVVREEVLAALAIIHKTSCFV